MPVADSASSPSPGQIHDAILRSGYLLESRVERLLQSRGITSHANVPYLDPDTAKSRELDLRGRGIHKDIGDEEGAEDMIWAELLIECVHTPHPIAFFSKDLPTEWDYGLDRIKIAGPPVQQRPENMRFNWYWLKLADRFDQLHHYGQGPVASQYCSFEKKKQRNEWFATHRDQDHEVFRKMAAATEFALQDQYDHMDPMYFAFQLAFFYPVVVVQGELLSVKQSQDGTVIVESSPSILFHHDRVYGREVHRYSIDIVTEAHLPQLLETIDHDLEAIAARMRGRSEEIWNSGQKRREAMLAGKEHELYP